MNKAIAKCNGNVPSVTNAMSLMIYLKNQGVRYVIVKAGTGADLFGVSGFNPQFTSDLVDKAHAAGLWIFGYSRSYATNTAGEVAIADYVFQQGGDGFVWDAEAEWESSRIGTQGPALAIAQCSQVRSNWPNKFLAHAPFPIITYHSSFPYKEFGYYCDAVMPQDYWIEIGVTPTYMVSWMTTQWKTWQSGLTGEWVNSIKPIVPAGQAWSSDSGTVTAAQMTEFFTALKNQSNPATTGGYKGANFWVCEDQPADVWDAIRTNGIGHVPTNSVPVIANVSADNITSTSAVFTWTTDQSSDSVVEYGLDTGYGSAITNSTLIYYHTVSLTNLSPYTTYHYRVKSKNAYSRTGISADYLFTTPAATISDVIIESYLAGPTLNSNPPYVDSQFVGTPSTCKSSAAGLSGPADARYSTGGSGSTPSVTLRPTLAVAGGTYNVYVTHCASSCSSDLVVSVAQDGCSGLPTTTAVFQSSYANTWGYVGQMTLNAGVTVPAITFTKSSGTLSSSTRMYSDGYKFVYVPPAPAGPGIVNQPQSLSVTQGCSATFSVTASGTPLLCYQWRFNGTNSVSGATGSVYTKSSVQAADSGKYSVVVTNAYGTTNSADATLTVLVPVEIVLSPRDVTTGLGLTATFSTTATGTAPISYQWQFNGTNIAGATASTLTVTNIGMADVGSYAVLVSNLYGTDTSYSASLAVEDPFIARQPQNQTLVLGANSVFDVSAAGTPTLSYRWFKEGVALLDGGRVSGAGTATLTIAGGQPADMGNYSVAVSNLNGQIVSSNATLLGACPPGFLTQPACQKVVAGSSALLTVTVAGMGPFTYQWRQEGTNLADGTKISGATSASLVVSDVQIGNGGNYSVVVSNTYGGTTSSNALVGLWPLAAWGSGVTNSGTSPNFGQAVVPASLSNLVAVAAGLYHSLALRTDGTVVAWGAGETNKGTSPHCGQAIVPSGLSNVLSIVAGYYHSLAIQSGGVIAAWGAGITNTGTSPHYGQAIVPAGLSNVVMLAAGGYHNLALNSSGTVTAWGAGTNIASNPHYGQAIVPAGLSNVVAVAAGGYHSLALKADGTVAAWGAGAANSGSSPDYGQAMVPAGLSNFVMIAAGGYHSMALQADGTVLAWGDNTYGQTNVPAGLSDVAEIAAGRYFSAALRTDGSLVIWGRNDCGQTNTPISVANTVGIASGGNHNLALENDGSPCITLPPRSQTVAAGASARLMVMAVGVQPLGFQWQRNGVEIEGATEAALDLAYVQSQNAGSYSVVVTNIAGTVISAEAVLTVLQTARPRIDSISLLSGGQVQLQISGTPGHYTIETASNLTGWAELANLTNVGGSFQYVDSETNLVRRFYRVRWIP